MSALHELSCQNCVNAHASAFRDLTVDELGKLDKQKSCVAFKKGQIMIQEGSRPHGVYCIHHGQAKLLKLGSGGKEQIIRFASNGDLVGYRSVLSNEMISASVVALSDVHACFIPKDVFFSFIKENPTFSLDLMKLACHELGEAGKTITNLAQKSVRERLAEVLLMMYSTFGEDEEGNLKVALTREEIANMVGTATESVIRLMSEMKADGHITLKGRKIRINNKSALIRIGNVFD